MTNESCTVIPFARIVTIFYNMLLVFIRMSQFSIFTPRFSVFINIICHLCSTLAEMFHSLFVNTPWQGEAKRFVSPNPSSINTAFSNLQGSGPGCLFLEDAGSRTLEIMMTG